jgi:hypothetical protein
LVIVRLFVRWWQCLSDRVCLTCRKARRYACGPAVVAGSGFGYGTLVVVVTFRQP